LSQGSGAGGDEPERMLKEQLIVQKAGSKIPTMTDWMFSLINTCCKVPFLQEIFVR
jgi:hypothetical protein